MGRIGTCVYGKYVGDVRDYFPFHWQASQTPDETRYRTVGLSFDKAFEWIHRVREMRMDMSLECIDTQTQADFPNNPEYWDAEYQHTVNGIRNINNELEIITKFEPNLNWPEWGNDEANDLLGNRYEQPLFHNSDDSFSPYCYLTANLMVVDTDSPGSEPNRLIQQITTYRNPEDLSIDLRISQVEATFMGEDLAVYELAQFPVVGGPAPYVTGTIEIKPTRWWSYDGIWSTYTGAQIITPVPGGW